MTHREATSSTGKVQTTTTDDAKNEDTMAQSTVNEDTAVENPYEKDVLGRTADASNLDAVHHSSQAVKPPTSLAQWILFNLLVPILLLASAAGVVVFLGSVEPSSRPPLDDSTIGRLRALPAVEVVRVQTLEETGEKLHLNLDGTVVPFREVTLATEVAGRIVKKSPACETGSFVEKGDLLIEIDPTDYEIEVERLQRTQQQQYEALGEADQELANTKRLLEISNADVELQRRELKRRQALPDQFASDGEIDKAKRDLLQAEQQLVNNQNQLDLIAKRRIRLESAEQVAGIQLKSARENLRRTRIEAPISGVIVQENAELNTFVNRGSPVVTLEDTSKVEVAADLRTDQLYWVLNQKKDEPDLIQPRSGRQVEGYRLPNTPVTVRFQLSGRTDITYQWNGRLEGYDGIGLDSQTRTIPVRIVVDEPQRFEILKNGRMLDESDVRGQRNGPSALVRGMFVSLQFQLDPEMPLVVLPAESLKPGNRVWQFVPTDSVLDVSLIKSQDAADIATPDQEASTDESIADTGDGDEKKLAVSEADSSQAMTVQSSPEATPSSFDPDAWVAGELTVLQDVRAIDEFIVSGNVDPRFEETTWWICEVGSEALVEGGFVIVSPLGSVRSEAFPVRAPAEVISQPADVAVAVQ